MMATTNLPQLHLDVLLSVAEKLLFSPDNDFRLDLREPNSDVVNFMFAGPTCRWTFFTQLRRLTKLTVNHSELNLISPTPIQGIKGALANNKEFFQGPFAVSHKFVCVLLCQGVLQPKIVDSFFKYGLKGSNNSTETSSYISTSSLDSEDEESSGTEYEESSGTLSSSFNTSSSVKHHDHHQLLDLSNESPAESLARLFLFTDGLDICEFSSDDFEHCNLELDLVKIQDDMAVFKHISRILNLNAKSLRLTLDISSEFDNCVAKFTHNKVTADRTRSITVSYTVDIVECEEASQVDFPFDDFFPFLRYMSDCCPNMDILTVHFLLQGEFSDEDFGVLSKWLKRTIRGFSAVECAALGITCDLTIAFRAFFPEATLIEASKTNHELATMGEPKQSDGSDNLTNMDMPDPDPETFTIARCIKLCDQPNISVVYSLIGTEDDSTNNDNWDGFNGNMLHPPPAPVVHFMPVQAVPPVAYNAVFDLNLNQLMSSSDQQSDDMLSD